MGRAIEKRIGDDVRNHSIDGCSPGVCPLRAMAPAVVECTRGHGAAYPGLTTATIGQRDCGPRVSDGTPGGKTDRGYMLIAIVGESPLGAIGKDYRSHRFQSNI